MIHGIQIEICCGSLTDAENALAFDIDRIELNSALELGGLTPSFGTYLFLRQHTSKKIICMIRPRPAGFVYSAADIEVMEADAELFLKQGADGIVFGFLNPDRSIDSIHTEKMTALAHSYHAQAVFHKAFDETADMDASAKTLINCGIDRILTGGHCSDSLNVNTLSYLQKTYGSKIEILPGGGIRADNVMHVLQTSGIHQFHMSAKSSFQDGGSYLAADPEKILQTLRAIDESYLHAGSADNLTGEDEELLKNDQYESEADQSYYDDSDERE